ncbi:DUF3108 domain-containing protein [Oceanibium sediminis]|uniref:DUF3108 domain-containing protein n=1 Tax=Oceanibium sediminis TaxID=2026339 RepID=UPI0013006AA7|nr:DUF3108 domain-containing protein [Oceanibium sediminis]
MRIFRRFISGRAMLGGAAMLAAAGVAAAAEQRQVYDVSLAGLKAARLEIAVNVEGGRYTAVGQVEGRGLVGAITNFYNGGTTSGRVLGAGRLQPVRYDGVQESSRRREVTILYDGGVPTSVDWRPPRKERARDIDPSDQGGALDPISATWAMLQDMPSGQACGRSILVYDGQRRSRLDLGQRKPSGDRFTCDGRYVRVAGYSPKQLAEQKDFPFTITYREVGGRMVVESFELDSIIGRAVVRRRQ